MNFTRTTTSLFAISLWLATANVSHAAGDPGDAATTERPDSGAASADVASAANSEIDVVGRKDQSTLGRQVDGGILGSKSALDTPFTVSAVTAEEIQNLQTKDINGVFRSDASITEINSSVAQASGASFRVRGVALDQLNSFKLDGLALPYWSIDLPIEQFDQIQLFKGATGFMYGFGSPAGVINFVTRRPADGLILSLDGGYRSNSLYSGHLDFSDRTADGRAGIRINGQGEDGHVYNHGFNYNYSGDVAVDYRITDRLTWTADSFFMYTRQEDEVNTVSVGPKVTQLDPVSGSANFGAKGDWKTNALAVATTGLDWNIDRNWVARIHYRYDRLNENFPGNLVTILDNAGDYVASAFFVRRLFKFNQVQATIEGSVQTGPLKHELVLGAEWEDQAQYSDVNSLATHPLGAGNIYTNLNISLANYPASLYNPILYELNRYIQKSPFAADTVSLGNVSLLLGVRYTDYQDTARGPNNAVSAIYKAKPVSPTVALTYALDPHTRAYVSYVQGLQNGGAAGSTNANNGATFGPLHTTQYEAGLKTEHDIWNGAAALFRTEQDADYVTVANVYVQSGKVRYQGAELSGALKPAKPWTLNASVTYLDTAFQDEGPVYTGKQVPGVAKVQAAGGVAYEPGWLSGLRLDADVKYTGTGYGNTVNTLKFPSHTLVDLAAAYGFDVARHHLVARVGVKNVGDKRYWIYNSSTVIPGEPRTYVAALHVGF